MSDLDGLSEAYFLHERGFPPPAVWEGSLDILQIRSAVWDRQGRMMLSGLKAIGRIRKSSVQLPEFEGKYDRSHYVSNHQSNHDIYFVYGSLWKILKNFFPLENTHF